MYRIDSFMGLDVILNWSFVFGKSVLNLTERMADKMDFQDESVSLTAPLLALSAINVDPDEFNGFTFGVSSVSSDLNPKVRHYKCNNGGSIFTYGLFL